jgi:hypothetical protein
VSIRTLSGRDLPKKATEKIREGDTASLGELVAADEYGYLDASGEAEWYDLRHVSTGAKAEVKTATKRIGGPKTAERDGRFRIYRNQMESLHSANARGTAWVVFVLVDMENREVSVRRTEPATVSNWISERGGWNGSGHSRREYEHKLPWPVVFE